MVSVLDPMPPPSPTASLRPRTLVLRDGRAYRLRPLDQADAAAVLEFFRTLSPESIRSRYGYLIHDMTPERAHRLVEIEPAREAALGIFGPAGPDGREPLCAMGRLVHAPDNRSAECAFLVHDRCRRLGMASHLLRHLRVIGRRRGLPRLFAQVRRDNRAMLEVFRRAGAQLHFDAGGDVVEIDIPVRKTKFLFDNPAGAPSVAPMATPEKKPFSFLSLAVDLVLTGLALTLFYYLIQSHVPSSDPFTVRLWATIAASCLAGVFWLALQMFKTVLRFQRDSNK
jgi:GNAT superfamily N-acetyltransferase